MSDRQRLEQRRDQALRDLADLAEQRARGELPDEVAAELRTRYEYAAASAMAALDGQPDTPPGAPARGSRGRMATYAVAAAAAVLALATLPASVGQRPPGGAVTGNEMLAGLPMASRADLSQVSDAELEAVVAANPGVIGMRVALADRYLEAGRLEEASIHYRRALDRAPEDPEAQAHFGWLLLHLGQPAEATTYVDRALAAAPELPDGLWFAANIALYGRDDPVATLDALARLGGRPDLDPTVRAQVDMLAAAARARQVDGSR